MDDKILEKETAGAPSAETPSVDAQPAKMSAVSDMPKSQALLDIEANAAEMKEAGKDAKSGDTKSAPQNLAVVARFRWVLLFVLSLAAVIFWTAEAQVSDRSYKFLALGYLAVSLILTIPTMKFLHIPTRGGLAAMLWAGTFFISIFSGGASDRLFDNSIPAALPWGGLLVMILLWLAVGVWRKVGRYKVIDIVLAVIIVYAGLAPVVGLASGIASGDVLSMSFEAITNTPFLLTNNLPWFLWPMTVILFLILPLCAIFALWDQLSILKRRGARHGGNFLLSIAFLLLLPYTFATYGTAVGEMPTVAASMEKWTARLPFQSSSETITNAPEEAIVVTELPATEPAPQEEQPTAAPIEEPTITPPAAPEEETQEQPEAIVEEAPSPLLPEATETPAAPPATAEEKITALENALGSANTRINTLERRLENLSRELEQLKRGQHPIPAPPTTPPPPMENPDVPAFSSNT